VRQNPGIAVPGTARHHNSVGGEQTMDRTQGLTRRRFLGQLAVAGGALALAACGASPRDQATSGGGAQTSAVPSTAGGAAQTSAAPSTAAAAATPGSSSAAVAGSTTFMNWDDIKGTPIEMVLQAYEKQTGQKVENVPNPGSGTEYETKVRTMLAGGTAPDIMRVNDDFVRYYSVKQQVRDLTPYIKRDNINPDDYYASIYDFAKQPTGTYGAWSIGNQPRVMYYNVNMFKDAGVPLPPKDWTKQGWTWNDFLETAKKLTKGDQQWGALVYDDTGCEQTWTVNNGVPDGIFGKDGKTFTLASAKGAEAMQWLADLTLKHKVQPERGQVEQGTTPNLGNNLFIAGKVGMIFRTQGTISYFRKNIPKAGDPGSFEWDVAPTPGNVDQKSEGSLICYAITKPAKNPDGAWNLLKFMGGPEGSKIFAEQGAWITAHKASNSYMKPGAAPPASYPANLALFSKATEFATVINFTENTEAARNVYRQEFAKVWNGQDTAQAVLDRVKKDVEEALSGKF
jgi:multiple sugar transport system substrate-binding protein